MQFSRFLFTFFYFLFSNLRFYSQTPQKSGYRFFFFDTRSQTSISIGQYLFLWLSTLLDSGISFLFDFICLFLSVYYEIVLLNFFLILPERFFLFVLVLSVCIFLIHRRSTDMNTFYSFIPKILISCFSIGFPLTLFFIFGVPLSCFLVTT